MNLNVHKVSVIVGLLIPLLGATWWAGSGYVEFNDRLALLERDVADLRELRARYEREQAKDALVNEQVNKILEDIEWLKYHHHHQNGEGRPHVD